MAYTTIDKPTDYFNTVLWSGDNTDNRSITNVNFQPDLVWQKTRNQTYSHSLFDNVRGVTKRLVSNDTAAETTVTDFKSFDSDGFTIDQGALQLNATGDTNVGWSWLGGGTASSNTDGSITSSVSANTTSGFSIVSYTGTGANATVGHGLGVAPKMVIVKKRDVIGSWGVYHQSLGNTNYLYLQNTDASTSSATIWNSTSPTSSVFSIGANAVSNGSSNTHIAYCFAEKKGFSKFGSYTGNGSADGPFVYTGFKPAMVILKSSSTSATNWQINDSTRDTYNVVNKRLAPSASDAEATNFNFGDFLSNGFKIRQADQTWNASGATYIYMAFAENPLVTTSGIPATAR